MTNTQKRIKEMRKLYMSHMFGKVYLSPEGLDLVVKNLLNEGISEEEIVKDAKEEQFA